MAVPSSTLYHRWLGWHAPDLRRVGTATLVGAVVGAAVLLARGWELASLCAWDATALTFLAAVVPIIVRADGERTEHLAVREDVNRELARVLLLAASGVSLAAAGRRAGLTRPEYGHMVPPPGPGFGDSIGAMTIAGGMLGALYRRERTGEPSVVDVSLLGSGIWAMGQALAVSLLTSTPWVPAPGDAARRNPLVGSYLTADGRYVSLCCLQAAHYWPDMCRIIGRPDLATDPRFADMPALLDNGASAVEILTEAIAARPLAEWRELLAGFSGQWTVAQTTLELAEDPQTVANGYIQECQTADGTSFRLAAAPVEFDGSPPVPQRAPAFNEHGDAILQELGYDWDAIVDLKVRGVVA